MTKRELKNKLNGLERELNLMIKYKEEFIEQLGKKGLQDEIDN